MTAAVDSVLFKLLVNYVQRIEEAIRRKFKDFKLKALRKWTKELKKSRFSSSFLVQGLYLDTHSVALLNEIEEGSCQK